MKKLICLASVLAMFGLTSCNNELGPEYTTPPTISNLTITPHVALVSETDTEAIADVYAGQSVTLSCNFSNTYGWSQIYGCYRTMTPEEYEGKTENYIEQMWQEKFAEKAENMEFIKSFETAPVSNQYFSFTIPGFVAGTVVRWDFGYVNQYSRGSGYIVSGRVPQLEYTVKENPDSDPESPGLPEDNGDAEEDAE